MEGAGSLKEKGLKGKTTTEVKLGSLTEKVEDIGISKRKGEVSSWSLKWWRRGQDFSLRAEVEPQVDGSKGQGPSQGQKEEACSRAGKRQSPLLNCLVEWDLKMTGVSVQKEKILKWGWTNMNSASEFIHDGIDRLVWHKDCMSPFCLSLGVCIKGSCASLGL